MTDDMAALHRTFERAYGRLSHEARRAFDRECAAHALSLVGSDDLAIARRVLELPGGPALDHARDQLAAWLRMAQASTADDAHRERIAIRVALSVSAATDRLWPNLASSDYPPRAASEARNAAYLDAYVRTADADAAEIAVRDALVRQLARIEELLRDAQR